MQAFVGMRSPPKQGLKAAGKFAELEWLYEVVVGPSVQGTVLIVVGVSSRDHDDPDLREDCSDTPAGFDSVEPGHVDIQQDQVKTRALHPCKRFFAVTRFRYSKTAHTQGSAKHPTQSSVIVNNQNTIRARGRHFKGNSEAWRRGVSVTLATPWL
jgi:hypothetical protein